MEFFFYHWKANCKLYYLIVQPAFSQGYIFVLGGRVGCWRKESKRRKSGKEKEKIALRCVKHLKIHLKGLIFLKSYFLGSSTSRLRMSEILSKVEAEARLYTSLGLHGVIVENMHDTPYSLEKDLG